MTTGEYRFPYRVGDKYYLLDVSDIHSGHADFAEKRLVSDLERYVDDRTIIFGNGDWFDSITVKDKRYTKQSDGTHTPAIINDSVDWVASLFHKYRKQIIGLGIGNHELKYLDNCNTDPMRILCDKLSDDSHIVRQLGYSSFLRFRFEHTGGGRVLTLTAYQSHGAGGGGTTDGYSTTKYGKKKAYYDADILFFGHDHDLGFKELDPVIHMTNAMKVVESRRWLVLTGGYLRTLNTGIYPNYAEAKCLPPKPIGCKRVEVELTAHGIELRDAS